MREGIQQFILFISSWSIRTLIVIGLNTFNIEEYFCHRMDIWGWKVHIRECLTRNINSSLPSEYRYFRHTPLPEFFFLVAELLYMWSLNTPTTKTRWSQFVCPKFLGIWLVESGWRHQASHYIARLYTVHPPQNFLALILCVAGSV